MAASTIFVFVLSLLLRASFSLPILLDLKTVHLTDSENPLAQKTPMFNAESILNLEKETKLVQSLNTETVFNAFESVEAGHAIRIRRNIFNPLAHCPGDTIPYGHRCLTPEEYDVLDGVDYHDVEI